MTSVPNDTEYAPYYETYISKVPKDVNILHYLVDQKNSFLEFIKGLSDEQLSLKYAEDKWTVGQVLMHIIETERIFAYRALAFSRNEKTPLPGFDQDVYVANNSVGHLDLEYFWQDFSISRNATVIMFKGFTEEQWLRIGTGSNNPMSVRAGAYIIAGHLNHHIGIFKERYGL